MTTDGQLQKEINGIVNDERLADRRLLVAYGSETGNSQDAAETLERLAERLRFQVHLCEMNDITFVSNRSCESSVLLESASRLRGFS